MSREATIVDIEDIAGILVNRDGQRGTLMESLACSYAVEGHLRAEIAKLKRELASEYRRVEALGAEIEWLRADSTAGGDA